MPLADKTMVCRDCGAEFLFTVGEQEFYISRGFQNEPSRCPECRSTRKRERFGGYSGREMYTAICASCGAECQVPFEPREGRPVYCSDCFSKMRSNR